MKFQLGNKVYYKRARVKGTVTGAWFDGVTNRYRVQCRLDVWSVPEAALEMQSDDGKSPEIPGSEKAENGDHGRV